MREMVLAALALFSETSVLSFSSYKEELFRLEKAISAHRLSGLSSRRTVLLKSTKNCGAEPNGSVPKLGGGKCEV